MHHLVLALTLDEVHPRHALSEGEPAHRGAERVGDLPQRRSRGNRQPELTVHIAHDPRRVLQLRDVHVQIHPVDTLDLEDGVLGNDIGHGTR
jgi:hypothetical protein